jgi:hypothetical protein
MKTLPGFLFAIHMSVVGVGLPQDSCKSTVVGDLRIEHFQSKTFGTNGQLLRDTTLLLRAPDRVAIGVGATEYNFPQSKDYFAPLRLTEPDAEAATLKMNQILASNLEQALIKRPEVQLVIEPGANHSAVYWSRRIPAALTFLYGEPGRVH